MSIAFDTSNTRIESSGFIRGLSCMIFESPEKNRPMAVVDGDQRCSAKVVVVDDDNKNDDDCCSSSSIGRNSDSGRSNSDGDDDDGEVQSSYKGPLDTLDALQEVLPIKRGISKFYSGKSKSFTSLADATSSSIKEIAKPENAYTRKRKNLLATSILLEKNRNNPLRQSVGGISKRRTFNLAGTPTSSSESITSENSNTSSSSPPRLPPLHPQTKPSFGNVGMSQTNFSSRRAYSLTDLQIAKDSHCSSLNNSDESKKHH
ncbi:hybrid signal transduction histidine kinase M-like protein [Thalictrum thalictroides]|uniref:Hybrid signal transduction histidine kinase M-like protein n=1 Tax=Thalictrum thalictroides TaxID=46969 RepID=A0A7J6X0R1_THATH|nr:hybrid signal transduction histidine kinase M-like protein [Thalictrum thalictroides]